ncbi:MAG: hypothetical protein MUF49_28960 [Oculatellaceae cyanobacterium Prado106]|jgi:hypothetical protein|nr:hypothetical protein [Oculatellaceae cyanobacterium Prado106]
MADLPCFRSYRRSLPGFWKTIWYALSLNGDFYENAHNTPRNRRIARAIVICAAVSYAIGSLVILLINRVMGWPLVGAIAINTLSLVAGYYFWTYTIWQISRWVSPNTLTYGDLLSPIGFAYAPQILNFLTLIPLLGRPIELILTVWSLLAIIVAVRQGLDISTRRSALICGVGWTLIQVAIGLVQVTGADG